MPIGLIKELLDYVEEFENQHYGQQNVQFFSEWLNRKVSNQYSEKQVYWEGKSEGRSIESVINSSLVHLFRYAKIYSKLAIIDSPFTTIDEVIFLLNLSHFGSMSKTALIDLNIHEKSTGIQIINRLLEKQFIDEDINNHDKRSRVIKITLSGKVALDENMDKVRLASKLVVGNLNDDEKLQLALLLQKLESYHEEKNKLGIKLIEEN